MREDATVVPRRSIVIEKGGAYVYVMRQDSTVEKRFIELGPEFQNNMVVERGVNPGENIVVEGQHKLSPGIKVRVGEVTASENESESADSVSKDSSTPKQ